MAARKLLSPPVLEFLRRYPNVHVDLITKGRSVDIVADSFDLGVRVADLVPSDMIAVSLGRSQPYAVVGSPAYFEEHGKPRVPPDLLDHACIRIGLPNGALYRWQFEKDGQTAQIDVSGLITLDEASLARTAVLEGVRLGFFMEQDVHADIAAGCLVHVLENLAPLLEGSVSTIPDGAIRRPLSKRLSAWPANSVQGQSRDRLEVGCRLYRLSG
jgi:DNA-binding transcriptional LysR family regulator